MGLLRSLFRQVADKYAGSSTATPAKVRAMIDSGQLERAAQAIEALSGPTESEEADLLCLRGDIAFRQHRDEDAESCYRQALKLSPGLPDAHYGLSLVMQARGEQEPALRHAQFAVNNGRAARLSAQLGLCHLELHNFSRASEALRRATRLDPMDKASWNNYGIARRALDDIAGARSAFARALEIDAGFDNARANLQLLESEQSRTRPTDDHGADEKPADASDLTRAIDACEELTREFPDDDRNVLELARLYEQRGDPQSALDVLRAYRTRFPDNLDVMSALGRALVRHKEFVEGKPLVDRALAALPDDTALLLAMADIRSHMGRYEEAGACIERAVALDNNIHMRGRLAANLAARCKYAEALELIAAMEAERPDVAADTLPIKIDALTSLGRHDEALPVLDEAIRINPSDPHRRFLRASINLLQERFEQGWDDYAYRNLASTDHIRMLPFPIWHGEALQGKTILVMAEQGLGDQVMFASCLPDLLALQPGRVIVEAVKRVAPTLARSFPTCEVVATNQDARLEWVRDLGHVDYFVMLGDLPRQFRRQRGDFPNHAGYFKADAASVGRWSAKLDSIDGRARPRIGFSWRGGTEMTRTTLRSLQVTEFVTLMDSIPATWVCLQYGDVGADLGQLNREVAYWPESVKDLDQFAALVQCLDLVVTVCNTTVHYAGALGKEVWVLAPKVPEWRYGLQSTVLPWYPSSKVLRQTVMGEWDAVLDQATRNLRAFQSKLADKYC